MPSSLIYALFFLSGGTGLIYELVWVRELIFVFGGTTYAITTVLVAFMAGLGLGSYSVGRIAHRLERPSRVYGCLEIGIGLYALLVPLLLKLAEPAYRGLYPHVADMPWLLTALRFCLSAPIVLLPATAMGATLPVLVRYITLGGGGLGRSVGRLYGINTLGAVAGTLAAGFWLIPGLGLTHTTWLAAAVNVGIGTWALVLLGRPAVAATRGAARSASHTVEHAAALSLSRPTRAMLLIGFAVSGFAAMVYQITWTRALVMSLGSSTYSFTCILAAFILGLAAGSLAVARWVDRWKNPVLIFGMLELFIGLVAVVIIPVYGETPYLAERIFTHHHEDYHALLRWQFLFVIAFTFVPTFLMGVIFPLVTRTLAGAHADPAAATGRAYAVNTIGTIAGSFLAGFVLIRSDTLGVQNSIILASVLNGLVGAALVFLSRQETARLPAPRVVAAVVLFLLIPGIAAVAGRWDPMLLNAAPFLMRGQVADFIKNRHVLYMGEGVDLTVAVMRGDVLGDLALTVNGKPDASTSDDAITQLLLGHIPALLSPHNERACVIGLGSGMTLSAIGRHPAFQHLDCIEISDEVVRAARDYFSPYAYNVLADDPRLRMLHADGRNHLLLTDQRYDVIVSEPSNPWMAGVANLFTHEFFELCRSRLNDDGSLGIWLQAYTMSLRDFQMVVHTLFASFDHVSLWQLHLGDFMLVASPRPFNVSPEEFQRRFETPSVWADLYRVGIFRPSQVLGRFVCADEPLRTWVANAPVHTDDNALLEFSAPRYLYNDESPQIADGLLALQRPDLDGLVSPTAGALPAPLLDEIHRAIAARWAPTRAIGVAAQGGELQAVRILFDAYRQQPADVGLLGILRDKANHLPGDSPDAAELKSQVKNLPIPFMGPFASPSLADVIADRREQARQAMSGGQWDQAVEHLRETRHMDPLDRTTRLMLASALIQAGGTAEVTELLDEMSRENADDGFVIYLRAVLAVHVHDFDAAFAHLDDAMRRGVITSEAMAQNAALQPLQADPRFAELLKRGAQSQPATAP